VPAYRIADKSTLSTAVRKAFWTAIKSTLVATVVTIWSAIRTTKHTTHDAPFDAADNKPLVAVKPAFRATDDAAF
jgi:nucleoside recognition membrane protein YjiH